MIDINQILSDKSESDIVDFKATFENTNSEWLELIKDIVAMANSGGGYIFIGIDDNGYLSNNDISKILAVDPADITNKIFSFTGNNFSNFKIVETHINSTQIAVLYVGATNIPIVFTKPGNYQFESGKQRNVFSVGSVYFRHGAKSEPCTSDDLRKFLEREINRTKESWLKGIRQVVEAPEGSKVLIVPVNNTSDTESSTPIRLVNDPEAPTLRIDEKDYFELYPMGYTQLIRELKLRYNNFIANPEFHRIRKPLIENPRYCKTRLLNPNSVKSPKITLYSKNIFEEFDKYYTLK